MGPAQQCGTEEGLRFPITECKAEENSHSPSSAEPTPGAHRAFDERNSVLDFKDVAAPPAFLLCPFFNAITEVVKVVKDSV